MTAPALLATIIVLGEWTGLFRGLLGGPFYAGALDLLLVALAAATGIRAFRAGRIWPAPLLVILAIAYLALAAVEVFNPNVPGLTVGLEGFRKTAFTMLALLVVVFAARGDAHRFFTVIALGSIPAFLWATRQAFFPLPLDYAIIDTTTASPISFHSGPILRAFAPTAGPFHLGILAGAVLVIALVRLRSGARWWLAVAILAGWTLGLTITRANIVAAIVAVLAIVVFATPWRQRIRMAAAGVPVLAATGFAVLLAIGAISSPITAFPAPSPGESPTWTPQPQTIGTVTRGIEHALDDPSLQLRFGYWKTYLAVIADRPLIGYGTSAAADGMDQHFNGTSSVNFEPHSIYFKAALELGLLGLALLVGLLGLTALLAIRSLAVDRDLGLIAIGLLALIGVSGITGPMLDAYPMNLLFWATAGWLARVTWQHRWSWFWLRPADDGRDPANVVRA